MAERTEDLKWRHLGAIESEVGVVSLMQQGGSDQSVARMTGARMTGGGASKSASHVDVQGRIIIWSRMCCFIFQDPQSIQAVPMMSLMTTALNGVNSDMNALQLVVSGP